MLTVVTFKWAPPAGYRSSFGPETVHVLRDMVARHYSHPHRFVCITDDARGLEGIETVALWKDHADVENPHGRRNPSCYRRLKLFDPAIAPVLGRRLVSLDLDTVIVGDLSALWNRPEPFVIWGQSDYRSQWYNGSMFMLTAGARPQVWTDFNPRLSPHQARRAGCFGSDQGWIRYCLGSKEATWGQADGVYSYRVHIAPKGNVLPANARIVFFHGHHDPWDYRCQQVAWIREHYVGGVAA